MTEHTSEHKAEKSGQLVTSGNHSTPPKREGLLSYFKTHGLSLKSVWPTRDDAVKMTIFVVIFVAILAVFIYAADSAISWLFFDVLLKRG